MLHIAHKVLEAAADLEAGPGAGGGGGGIGAGPPGQAGLRGRAAEHGGIHSKAKLQGGGWVTLHVSRELRCGQASLHAGNSIVTAMQEKMRCGVASSIC